MNARQRKYYNILAALVAIKEPKARLLGNYVDAKTRISTDCGKEHVFDLHPDNFKTREDWCTQCSDLCPIKAERDLVELLESRGEKLLSEYKGTHIPVTVLCPVGHIYYPHPASVKCRGSGCRWCEGCTVEQGKARLLQVLNDRGETLMSEYINNSTKVDVRCPEGHIYSSLPVNIVTHDTGCSRCSDLCPNQAEERMIAILTLRGEKLLSPYVNYYSRVTVECPEKHVYYPRAGDIYHREAGCPTCVGSTMERDASRILTKHNIWHKPQYADPLEPKLHFDYQIRHQGREIRLELDGRQHFEYIKHFYPTPEDLLRARERDRIKNQLCYDQKIQLIRIPYTQAREMEELLLLSLQQTDATLLFWDYDLYAPLCLPEPNN